MTTVVNSGRVPNRFAGVMLYLVDGLIAVLIFVLPFIMGGREAWGHWFLISVSLLLGAAWSACAAVQGCRYRISWLELFLIAGLGIAWFQVQPRAPETMAQFSSEYERLLPAWADTQETQTSSDSWATLSFTPVETRHAWWVFLAYAVILTVLFQRVRETKDCTRLLQAVGIVGVSMTGFALFQWATSNGRFFWFYEHPYTDPTTHLKGAFTNRNHFAQFLSLTIGPLLWWLFRDLKLFLEQRSTGGTTAPPEQKKPRRKRKQNSRSSLTTRKISLSQQSFGDQLTIPILLLLCAVAIVIVAVLLSLSRGGMIAAAAATVVALVGLWRGLKLGGAMAGLLLGGGLLFFSLLGFSDQEQLQTKLDQLLSADADKIDTGGNRRAVWAADAKVIRRFPLLGTGVGSHRDVYSIYMDNYAEFALAEMTHAESSFVHIALETGLIGAGGLAAALLLVLFRLTTGALLSRTDIHRAMTVAVIASAVGAILHAVVDFIWYVPAIVVVSLVLLVVGLKTASRSFGNNDTTAGLWFPRVGWAAAGGFCLLGLIHIQPELMTRIEGEKHWYAALRVKLDVADDETDGFDDLEAGDSILLDEAPVRLSAEEQARQEAAEQERQQVAQLKYLKERVKHLSAALKANPDQHRVQAALADQLLRLFDLLQIRSSNPMPLNMVRDAALASDFDSSAELQSWARRACGNNIRLVSYADRLSREALAGCPVLGHAYLNLMETRFLTDPKDTLHQNLIDQAMLVRGYDPRVRFVAGREAMMVGENETALSLWESVFHSTQYFRMNILRLVAQQVPVEFFLQQFEPNAEELKDLRTIYTVLERDRDIRVVLDRLCDAIPLEAPSIEDDDERLEEMMIAYAAARELEDLEKAIRILTPMIDDFPLAFEPRYHLGATLVDLERPEEAMPHLQWCHEHDPGNIWVPRLIVRARKLLLKAEEEPRYSYLQQ